MGLNRFEQAAYEIEADETLTDKEKRDALRELEREYAYALCEQTDAILRRD